MSYPCCFPGEWKSEYFEELCNRCGIRFGSHQGHHPHINCAISPTCSGFERPVIISKLTKEKIEFKQKYIKQLESWVVAWRSSRITPGYANLIQGAIDQIAILKREIAEEIDMASKKTAWWDSLRMLIPAGRRGLLVGPPGTGKSTTAARLLKDITGHAHRITMTEGTGIEDLIGMYQLKDGETIWCDGPAVKAMKEGTGLIIDEVDKHSAEVGSLFYALLDDEPQVTLPTGEHVIADDKYKVLCTSNANISALPEAIIDRMEFVLLAMAPHPDAMEQLTKPEAAAVQNYYRGVAPTNWQWTGLVTLRRMRSFHKLIEICKDEVVVAEAVFGMAGKEVLSSLVTSAVAGR